jgi:hypothetical protein
MKKVVLYASFLPTYIAQEHYMFIKNLEKYGWELVEAKDINTVSIYLQKKCVLFLFTYDGMDISSMQKSKDCILVYKYDDHHFQSSIRKSILSMANYLISPYAYLNPKSNKKWVPYSCVDEFVNKLDFNKNPIEKIFVSGAVSEHYPFRQYVLSLGDYRIVQQSHPGYGNKYDTYSKGVGIDYTKTLNNYICCFVDASRYDYIMLKNFEIAASGSLLLTDISLEKHLNELGFVDNKTCIMCNQSSFLDKITYILDSKNREIIDTIRYNGMRLAREKHLTSMRSKDFNDFIESSIALSNNTVVNDEPIVILVCGCQKYLKSTKDCIQRLLNKNYIVIGLVGDMSLNEPIYNNDENILYLNVKDTYEDLPFKICSGIEWCYKKWPKLKGIFKTDDDIIFEDNNHLFKNISENTHIPYWGVNIETTTGGVLSSSRLDQFSDKTLKNIQYYSATYCWGAGYWISNKVVEWILDYRMFLKNPGSEDNNIGFVINRGGWFPKHIPIKWNQPQRVL